MTLHYSLLDEPLIRARLAADGRQVRYSLPGLFVAMVTMPCATSPPCVRTSVTLGTPFWSSLPPWRCIGPAGYSLLPTKRHGSKRYWR